MGLTRTDCDQWGSIALGATRTNLHKCVHEVLGTAIGHGKCRKVVFVRPAVGDVKTRPSTAWPTSHRRPP
jgi:hypothetical protein